MMQAPSQEDKNWVQRTISLPIQECLSGEWRDFLQLCHDSWQHSTGLANWAAHTLRAHDVVRTPGLAELPPLTPVDLYALAFGRAQEGRSRPRFVCPECPKRFPPCQCPTGLVPPHRRGKTDCPGAGQLGTRSEDRVLPVQEPLYEDGSFWAGGKASAATLLRKIDRKYRKERAHIVWTRERRTPEFRYPYPFPVHQDSWEIAFNDGKRLPGQPFLFAALPGGRICVRLRNGQEFAGAMRVVRDLVEGKVARQELSLTRQRTGSHLRHDVQRRPGGGYRDSYRVMVRIAYRREVSAAPGEKIALARTGKEPFLTLTIFGEESQYYWHCEWVKNWVVAHQLFRQRFADDLKFEKRWPAKKRHNLNRYQERRCDKHARQMESWRQQLAEQVVGLAARRGCGRLIYDDSDRTFTAELPWFLLARQVEQECAERCMAFEESASSETAED